MKGFSKMSSILGIDPGTGAKTLGLCIIDTQTGEAMYYETLNFKKVGSLESAARYILELCNNFRVKNISIEDFVYYPHLRTAPSTAVKMKSMIHYFEGVFVFAGYPVKIFQASVWKKYFGGKDWCQTYLKERLQQKKDFKYKAADRHWIDAYGIALYANEILVD